MNHRLMSGLALGMALLSACEKKEIKPETIVVERDPGIFAYYKTFNPENMLGFIIALDRTTHVVRDTFYRNQPFIAPNAVLINKISLNAIQGQTNQLKDFDYVLQFQGRSDTIRNVSYDSYLRPLDCLSCTPDQSRTVMLSDYTNLTFTYQGKTYSERDSLIIE